MYINGKMIPAETQKNGRRGIKENDGGGDLSILDIL
jgi:hypothetical protein